MRAATRQQQVVSVTDLAKSRAASERCERAVWAALAQHRVKSHTPAAKVLDVLRHIRTSPPAWATWDAWAAMCDTFDRWVRTFGDLQLFDELGRKAD